MPCIRNYLVLPIGIPTGSNSYPLPWSQNALGRIEMRQNDTKHTMRQGTEMRDAFPLLCWNAPDMEFFWLVLLLTTIGLIMLLSASYPTAYYEQGYPYFYFARQLIFAVIGILLMIGISFINYEYFRILGKPLIIISLLLLAVVLIPGIGIVRNHAQRWLSVFGLFNFQPSEIAKLAVVLEFSSSISVKHRQMRTFRKGIFPYAFILGLISFLMAKEPHLSGLILIVAVGVILLFAGGIHPAWIIAGMAAVSFAAYLLLSGAIPYGQSRIAMWEDPFADAAGDGYQLSQSLIAIGSGGLWGLGLGKSRQKLLFLPEVQNDFIFSIVAEELGLVGATLILLIFSLLIIRGYHDALRAKDRFGALLCVGITSLLAMQTFLNVAVVTGLLPTTGISLPFFSYGGTALVTQLMEMGIILSVSRQATG